MVEEILPGVYDITVRESDGRRYRVYLVEDDVPVLFDAGFEETTDRVIDAVETIGTEPERLVVTHGDPDHVGGYSGLVEAYDLETWVPEQTETDHVQRVDNRYADGDVIGSFEAIYAPGHEPDNYALVDEEEGVLVTGDALFGADLRGFPEGYLISPPALYSANVNRAEASLEKLLEYDFETALVFHGSAVVDSADERLDAFVNFPGKPEWATYE